ncbi:hypothetical protein [Ensifer soli]|uniref:hypothetical protein n=1 Tax=Ciceribacter sp. sgz301302 TaxID=3342379 RepID=UPI0035B98434
MAYITSPALGRQTTTAAAASFVLTSLMAAHARVSAELKRRSDARMLESLPYETLKDIGFPVAGSGSDARA